MLGNSEAATAHPPTQRTIEFGPNRNLQGTKLDTIATQSLTDVEATAGSDDKKMGGSTLGSRELIHAQ